MKYHSLNNPSIANAIAIVLLAVVGASPAQAVHGAQNGDRSSSRRRSQGVETTVNKVQSRTARPASRSMNSVRRTDPAPIVSAPIVSAPIVVAKPKSLPQHIGSLLRKIGGPHKSQTSERKNSRSEPTRRGKPAPIIQGDVAHASQRRAEAGAAPKETAQAASATRPGEATVPPGKLAPIAPSPTIAFDFERPLQTNTTNELAKRMPVARSTNASPRGQEANKTTASKAAKADPLTKATAPKAKPFVAVTRPDSPSTRAAIMKPFSPPTAQPTRDLATRDLVSSRRKADRSPVVPSPPKTNTANGLAKEIAREAITDKSVSNKSVAKKAVARKTDAENQESGKEKTAASRVFKKGPLTQPRKTEFNLLTQRLPLQAEPKSRASNRSQFALLEPKEPKQLARPTRAEPKPIEHSSKPLPTLLSINKKSVQPIERVARQGRYAAPTQSSVTRLATTQHETSRLQPRSSPRPTALQDSDPHRTRAPSQHGVAGGRGAAVLRSFQPITPKSKPIQLALSSLHHLRLTAPVARIEVGDPTVCEVFRHSSRQISLVGKRTGETMVTLHNGSGRPTVAYRVQVGSGRSVADNAASEQQLEEMLAGMYPDSHISLTNESQKLVVRGDPQDDAQAVQIISLIRSLRLVPVVDRLKVQR